VFDDWWNRTARSEYLGFSGAEPAPAVTFYYDPTIDYHHRLPVSLGGLFPAYYLATQQPADARALFEAALFQMGLTDLGAPIAPPGPRGTAIVIHLAREWGMAALADALGQAADERYEPTWDREGGEFTWGFGLDEEHPRGQYNAAMAAAEAMTEGAWHRLAQVLPSERFNQPTVTGIDFPDFTLTQAWWDGERRRLVLTSTGRAEADTRKPTTFRVTNLGDPSGWTVEAEDGGPVESSAVDGDLEVRTTIGTHRLVVRRA